MTTISVSVQELNALAATLDARCIKIMHRYDLNALYERAYVALVDNGDLPEPSGKEVYQAMRVRVLGLKAGLR